MSAEPSDTSGTDFRGKLRSRKFILVMMFSMLLCLLIVMSLLTIWLGQGEKFNQTVRLIETVMPFITAVVGAYIGFNYISQKKK